VPLRTIAEQRSVSKSALIRHRDAHIPEALVNAKAAVDAAQADTLLAQVHALVGRAMAILDQADAAGELRIALAANREARGNLELLGKLAGQLRDSPQVEITLTPEWAEWRTSLIDTLNDYPEAKEAVFNRFLELERSF
jgi:hypothetical protein